MKRILAGLMVVLVFWCSPASAATFWWKDEAVLSVFENAKGFSTEYDDMEDALDVLPAADSATYLSGSGVLAPKINSFDDMLFFIMMAAADGKFNENVTRVIILVDDVRYDIDIPEEVQYPGFADIIIGDVGVEMIRAIVNSQAPVKARVCYESGNVDFEMSPLQISSLDTLLRAFEEVGGMEQENFLLIDMMYPITKR